MAAENKLDASQLAPLLNALIKEPSADTRETLLKALVRLPLSPEAWIAVAASVYYLLEAGVFAWLHDGESPPVRLEDAIEAAAFVPVKQVREALRCILSLEHPAARKVAARALAFTADPFGARDLLRQLHDSDPHERYEAAKYTYRLRDGVVPYAQEIRDTFDKEDSGSVKFWLALSLGIAGEAEPLETLFDHVQQGKCDMSELWINPDEYELAGPLPEAVVPVLERLVNKDELDPSLQELASDLFELAQPSEPTQEPPWEAPEYGEESAQVSRQMELVLDDFVARSERSGPDIFLEDDDNLLPDIMNNARGRFSPNVESLFSYFRKLHALYSTRRHLAWAVSRAPFAAIAGFVSSKFASEDATERYEAAELLELAARYRTTAYAPYFGGGAIPNDVAVEPAAALDFRDYGLTSGGAPPGYVGGSGSLTETVAAPSVHLAAAVVQAARPGDRFVAAFAAYVQEQEEKVREEMHRRSPHSEPQLDMKACRWRLGTAVKIVAAGGYLSVDPPIEEFVWEGGRIVRSFEVTVASDAPIGNTVLKFNVYIAEARVAVLPLQIEITPVAVATGETRVTAESHRTAFASYSSADRLRVLERVSEISLSAGIDIFQDCLDLRPGEQWKPALEREIQTRHLFFLFWSAHAKASNWVEWEWRTALREKGLDAIELRPLEPVEQAPPPPELAALHFSDPLMMIREYFTRQAAGPPV